ncbi:hypothetical protein GCM10018782_50380 [Streptomyces griseoaurantiacus]|nr:hypothetical protein GCM10018782_50380 [Streptomyces griseoaurantiacus]
MGFREPALWVPMTAPPLEAACWEGREEFGIEMQLQPTDLLVVEWLQATPHRPQGPAGIPARGPRPARAPTDRLAVQRAGWCTGSTEAVVTACPRGSCPGGTRAQG